jgi:hypothetical protein
MSTINKAQNALLISVRSAGKRTPLHPYTFEHDRWLQLAVLMLTEGASLSKEQAAVIAAHLGSPHVAGKANRERREQLARSFESIIRAPDFDHGGMERIAMSVGKLATDIKRRYGGGVQSFLRFYGNQMVSALTKMLRKAGVSARKAHRIATVWLQNSANMPVLSMHEPHVKAFCKRNRLTFKGLLKAADSIALNLGYLDDILLLAHLQANARRASKKRAVGRTKRAMRKD